MFRAECKAGTALGQNACALLARGELIPDAVVNEMVAARVAAADCAAGFLLDGYPRTVRQASWFSGLVAERGLEEPVVVHIDVPDEPLVRRLSARRQCPTCHRIYNLLSQPPAADGVCDADRNGLITRDDDREFVIRDRLRAYAEQTNPVLDWYGESRVVRVDGTQAVENVSADIEELLRRPLVRSA
jgi:adenylate kinase